MKKVYIVFEYFFASWKSDIFTTYNEKVQSIFDDELKAKEYIREKVRYFNSDIPEIDSFKEQDMISYSKYLNERCMSEFGYFYKSWEVE